MANQEHLAIMKQGIGVWNNWRTQHPQVQADLSEADLSGAYLRQADLFEADLRQANLRQANLRQAYLSAADLYEADLYEADLSAANLSAANLSNANLSAANLSKADFSGADLNMANLSGANLSKADLNRANLDTAFLSKANLNGAILFEANLNGAILNGANLSEAYLSMATLVGTDLTNATLKDCRIYGISAWDIHLDGAEQLNLIITPQYQPTITVDNLKIAQFIYLLLNNKEIRDVITTLTTKSVLLLGRFTPERKAILDALREALRQHNYLPILFDYYFDPISTQPVRRETVRTLAHLSHFIIADLTSSSSIPEELEMIVPTLAVPIQPLLEITQKRAFSMFKGYGVYDWVLPLYHYTDLEDLLDNIQEKVIEPATRKAQELEKRKVRLNQEPFE